jgi:hypothetical protein
VRRRRRVVRRHQGGGFDRVFRDGPAENASASAFVLGTPCYLAYFAWYSCTLKSPGASKKVTRP